MARPSTDPRPTSAISYGSHMTCPSCTANSDIWAEVCACGTALLPDDRKIKLAKSGAAPAARLVRRAQRLAREGNPEALDQAVRDLAALRALPENAAQPRDVLTSQIIDHLVKLGRLDEACAEAETLPSEGKGVPATVTTIEALARACVEHADPRAERWVRRFLAIKGKGREHLQMQTALVALLTKASRGPEALEAFEVAVAELEALRKKTSKSGLVALTGASGDAFATGYWGEATAALDTLRKPTVGAAAAAATADGQVAAAEVQRLAAAGDPAAASATAIAAEQRLGGAVKRLKPLAAGLSRSDRSEVMDPLESIAATLHSEGKRLKKEAKRR